MQGGVRLMKFHAITGSYNQTMTNNEAVEVLKRVLSESETGQLSLTFRAAINEFVEVSEASDDVTRMALVATTLALFDDERTRPCVEHYLTTAGLLLQEGKRAELEKLQRLIEDVDLGEH